MTTRPLYAVAPSVSSEVTTARGEQAGRRNCLCPLAWRWSRAGDVKPSMRANPDAIDAKRAQLHAIDAWHAIAAPLGRRLLSGRRAPTE